MKREEIIRVTLIHPPAEYELLSQMFHLLQHCLVQFLNLTPDCTLYCPHDLFFNLLRGKNDHVSGVKKAEGGHVAGKVSAVRVWETIFSIHKSCVRRPAGYKKQVRVMWFVCVCLCVSFCLLPYLCVC